MHKEKGTLVIFDDPENLLQATELVRKMKIEYMEVYTPFPIHGMEHTMGLKRSWIPWVTLILALSGWCLTFLFQAWTSAVAWPIIIGGKPYVSWPALIPVTFEGMVLIAGVFTTFTLLAVCRLPNITKKVFDSRLTKNCFGLLVEKMDPHYNEDQLVKIFKECDAKEVKHLE